MAMLRAAPLTELLKKGVPDVLPWSDWEENSFQQLKDALTNAKMMSQDNAQNLQPTSY